MRKRLAIVGILLILCVAAFGWRPLGGGPDRRAVLSAGYNAFETGVRRLPNGTMQVSALTRMPGVKAEMVEWWFSDFLRTTEHYKWWHPQAHIWMDWENKTPGQIVGASHLVHEYIGPELMELRIQFVPPEEILGSPTEAPGRSVVCARAGLLEEPLNVSRMCHVIRDTPWGAEMRSIFWMGEVAKRDGDDEVASIEGLVGNLAIARMLLISEQDAVYLMQHAIEEMGYLSDLLPALYAAEHAESTSPGAPSE